MTIKQFIKECAKLDSPIGDLAKDALNDRKFKSKKSEKEIIDYLNFQTSLHGTNDVFKEFISEYNRLKNNPHGESPRFG